jgi:plasmid maintenance system killer protein
MISDHPERKGKPLRYSIHVNGPWCITFRWDGGNATEVDLVTATDQAASIKNRRTV